MKHSSLKKIETEGNPIPLKRQKEIEIINKILKNEQDLVDNDYETNEYFIKLKLDDFYTAYLTLFSIATGIIYHDISQQPDFPAKEIIRKCNIFLTSVFVFLFILCSLTKYINLLNLIGSEVNRLFVIKCYVLMNPIKFLIVCTTGFIISTAYLLRIAEGPAYTESMGLNDFRNYLNCVWNVIVTMTTVGYGDYYPITNIGRIVNIFVSIWGTFLTSLMVVALQNLLVFTDNEDKAFTYAKKQEQKENFERQSVQLFKAAFIYNSSKRRYKKASELNYSKETLEKLRLEIDKALNHRAKIWREYKNQFHFFRNTYEVLNETDLLKGKMNAFQDQLEQIDYNTDKMEKYVDRMEQILTDIENKAKGKKNTITSSNLTEQDNRS